MQVYNPESIIENDDRKKILITILGNINLGGGINAFFYNMLSNMDCNAFCIHIYVPGIILTYQLADLFKELGAVIYTGGKKGEPFRETVWQDLEYLTSLNHYDVIHSNSGKIWFQYYACYFGIKNNIPKRIVHSHNALLPRIKQEVQKQEDTYREYILENATDFLACSEKAAIWMFGLQFRDYTIINNGIDLEKYKYNKDIHIRYHKELGIEDKFVVGHVGRFAKQKNHTFLIDIFKEITICNENSILLMAGDGELFEEIKYKAEVY
ncbi:MAG: glycosyltransferase family 1 protein, partial [Lachnospiraceae bacterium]|nr:glycosyltransferase family 1 protein [Lachnospiraceae bacterium]